FHFSDRSFYCFYGENESGKSTLQQFILYMMFGLPPKKRKKFIPKKQGNIAGTLTVYDETLGEITVQRIDGNFSCFLENGDKRRDRKSTRLNSSHVSISYAVFCLKKK